MKQEIKIEDDKKRRVMKQEIKIEDEKEEV